MLQKMSEDYENKISLVGFAGMKQSGKTTSAKALKHHGYRIYSFADPIRKLCRALGITKKYYNGDKDEPIPHLGKKTARYIMQTIGTDWGRAMVSETIWLDMMERRLVDAHNNKFLICIDDVRFDNEARLIKSFNGVVVKIVRGDTQSDSHISEAGVSDDLIDVNIENTDSVTSLSDTLGEYINERSLLLR
jgi:hypothetical protein